MTLKKYLRLCIVLAIPLLIFGIVAKIYFDPYEKTLYMLCQSERGGCRIIEYTKYDSYEEKDQVESKNGWFGLRQLEQIEYSEFEYPEFEFSEFDYTVSATKNMLFDINILDLKLGTVETDEIALIANSIVGRKATLFLGDKEAKTIIQDNFVQLKCFSVNFYESGNRFKSTCEGNGWRGVVTYRVSEVWLDRLIISIKRNKNFNEVKYLKYKILMYPLFVYIFLFLSLMAYITSKVITFVKNG